MPSPPFFPSGSIVAEMQAIEKGVPIKKIPTANRSRAGKGYPVSAVRSSFFTRRSGRAEACGRLLSSPHNGGLTSATPTRRPFVKMWVKAETWRTPQDTFKSNGEHYSRDERRASIGNRRFHSIWKICIKKRPSQTPFSQ